MTTTELWKRLYACNDLEHELFNVADAGILLLEGIEQVLEENGIEWDMDMLQRRKEMIAAVNSLGVGVKG